ncbi:hypothetical protein RHGRI_017040 [Rhododendron griersonianum]|uniref:Uncharacterized protein n=1 Tax=Rhododendron griersonianum TaxID=479676 RepID=A0AAV6JWG2_9ERIC|nr:hypothetical protein RHGRI_017040 [Rhododendron griersonianum]
MENWKSPRDGYHPCTSSLRDVTYSLKNNSGKACQVFRPTVRMKGLGSSLEKGYTDQLGISVLSSLLEATWRLDSRWSSAGQQVARGSVDICGSCGHELNLSSSGRNTSTIGSKYRKSIKRGIISFFYIDESRFTQVEELRCGPFISKNSWGLFRRRTKLLCRKCGNLIGMAYDDHDSAYPLVSDGLDSASGTEISSRRKYDVRIRALQPSSSGEVGIPLAV